MFVSAIKILKGSLKKATKVQWNPVNTTTLGPWKFGRINGVVVLTG